MTDIKPPKGLVPWPKGMPGSRDYHKMVLGEFATMTAIKPPEIPWQEVAREPYQTQPTKARLVPEGNLVEILRPNGERLSLLPEQAKNLGLMPDKLPAEWSGDMSKQTIMPNVDLAKKLAKERSEGYQEGLAAGKGLGYNLGFDQGEHQGKKYTYAQIHNANEALNKQYNDVLQRAQEAEQRVKELGRSLDAEKKTAWALGFAVADARWDIEKQEHQRKTENATKQAHAEGFNAGLLAADTERAKLGVGGPMTQDLYNEIIDAVSSRVATWDKLAKILEAVKDEAFSEGYDEGFEVAQDLISH